MKRFTAILLCLCLVAGMSAAYAADKVNMSFFQPNNTESSDTGTDANKYIIGGTNIGDVVYVLTNMTVERWAPGDTAPTVVIKDFEYSEGMDTDTAIKDDQAGKLGFSALVTDGTVLYGLNRVTGTLWKLADANGMLAKPEVASKLDWTAMNRTQQGDEAYTYVPQMGDTVIVDGVMYGVVTDWNAEKQTTELLSWTVSTGKMIADKKDVFLCTINAYKDGLLLGKYYDQANSWDQETQTLKMPQMVTYNPATGEVTKLIDFESTNIYGVRYMAATDTVYYVDSSIVYSMVGLQKPAKVSAYIPNNVWDDSSIHILPSGMVAVIDYNGMIVRGLDMPGIENGALTIYGEYGSAGHQAYLAANPQALVTCSQDYYSSLEQFTNAMVSGTNTVDVLRLDASYSPLARLIDKGYALDLSGYADLKAIADSMDPNLTKICMKDGKLYGLPTEIYATTFGYDKDKLEELGLTPEDVPTNFMELLDFVANWQADYGEDHPDVALVDGGTVKGSLLSWLMDNYVAYQTQQGQAISFDTDLFRKLITKLDSIDFTDLDPTEDEMQKDSYMNRQAVFSLYTNVAAPDQYHYNMQYVLLPLDEGMEPVVPATLQVMIVNPRTTHLEQAVQYLTVYAQNLEPSSSNITLFPNHNEPIVNKDYETNLASWKKDLADSQKQLETATDDEKASLNDNIKYLQGLIDDSEDYRYTVSAKDITTYREQVAPHLVVVGQNPLNTWGDDGTNQFSTLQNQYLDGAITADQLVKEMDKRMKMMQMEDQ